MPRCALAVLLLSQALFAGSPPSPTAPAPALLFNDPTPVTATADGGLRPVVGVQNIQVVRANRTAPDHADLLAHTYLHAPMLAWWRGQFYLDYLSAAVNEHDAPTVTSYMTSRDGLTWTTPRLLFPALTLLNGEKSIMHQRASFYVAPGDRLLATGFHGKSPAPNDGTGIGRVVREIHADGTLGPVYFIRLSRHNGWNETNAPLPLYSASPDIGFVAACNALLADHRATAQWWEEDRSNDGFYSLTLKAVSTLRLSDGSLIAIAKDAQHAISRDEGLTWQRLGFVPGLPVNSSKYWLQPTSDGRYALAFNPTNRLRFPLGIATSDDAKTFGDLLAIHSELPPQRFPGRFKNVGPQYVRGISDGNGTPIDRALWLTYSVNKEDIWIARVPVPIRGRVSNSHLHTDFSDVPVGALPADWNIYSTAWAPVRVVATESPSGNALELRDEDPCDYARAIRIFPATHGLALSFKVLARQTTGRLEIELITAMGARPLRLALTEAGRIEANHEGIWTDAGAYQANRWITLSIELPKDPKADRVDVLVDGKLTLPRALVLAEPFVTVERLSFRTGAFRDRGEAGHEIPGADVKAPRAAFLIDDVDIAPVR